MSVRILHCPNCGDLWKRIRFERFIRLGAPLRQCRACNSWHDSEHAEWPTLKWSQKFVFLAQNLFRILPPALLFLVSVLISQLLGLVPEQDVVDYSVIAGLVLLGFLALLLTRSVMQIVLSVRRARRRIGQARREQNSTDKFISDAAWQASLAARPRFPALQATTPAKQLPQEREIVGESRFLHPA